MKKLFFRALVMSFLMTFQLGFAQKTVSGTVTDTSGVPLPGATVVVQGTSNGVTTNFDGDYSISASEGDVLVVSFVGFESASATVGAASTYDFSLSEGNALEEVVVTALGISREKKSLGYSQQTVAGDVISESKQVDLNVALTGKVAGVQMIGGSSSTFDNGFLRLRGESDVLYVVDGIKIYAMSDINVDNIESISVLKGAAATALYGADAKSGVIVITSKSAKAGETSFEVNHSTSISSISLLPNYQNEYGGGYYTSWDTFSYNPNTDPAEWAAFNGQLIPYYAADESWGPKLDGTLVRHWDSWIPNHPEFGTLRPWEANPDNVKNFFNDGIENSTTLAFNAGSDTASVRGSARLIDESLPFPNTDRNQIDVNMTGDVKIGDGLTAFASLNYQYRKTLNFPTNGYGGLGANFNQWWQRQLDMDRLERNYFFEGKYYSWNRRSARNATPLYWDAPHFDFYGDQNNQRKNVMYGNFGLNYEVSDNISADVVVRRRFNSYESNGRTGWGGIDTPSYRESTSRYTQNEAAASLTYSERFDEVDVQAVLGYQVTQNRNQSINASTVGGLTVTDFYSIATSVDRPNYSSSLVKSKSQATYASISVGYDSTLYVDGSYRLDWGSTANPDENRIETWGLSGSFIFGELLDASWLDFGKLRAGYSESPVFPGAYATTQVYNVGTAYGNFTRFSVPNTQSNPNLLGGTRTEFEAGVELNFLNNRLGLDVTYFDRKDKDQPISIPVSGATGYTGLAINSGQSSAEGIEITLNTTPVQTADFNWDLSVNFATLNKYVDFLAEGIETRVLDSWMSWYGLQTQERVGEEWGVLVGRKKAKTADGTDILTSSGRPTWENNQILGNLLPDFTGGLTSQMRYKNWNLGLGFDFQAGGKFYSTSNMFSYYSGLHEDTVGLNDKGIPKRDSTSNGGGVHVTGVDASGNPVDTYMSASFYYYIHYFGNHEHWLYDASYVKLRTARLGYNFPKTALDNTPFDNVNVSLVGNNLLLLYSNIPEGGLDPSEIEGSGSIASGYRNVEGGQLPPSRTIGINVSLTF
ncbi:MAG: SusC/RagA family TonB-linked outer membrane protein [Flavobacteriaceae bacterium]|nr:SusC/RagA family TonB-linked outer membrane protein [Flavobacteriaceae bacterium]